MNNPRSVRERSDFVVATDQLWKSYDRGRIVVLKGVSVSVRRGEVVALWGASGSGKSTLLHLIGGLDLPDRGRIACDGLNPALESHRLTLRRRILGFVFQLHNLIPDLTVEENCMIPGVAVGADRTEVRERIRELTTRVGLEHRLEHRVQDLSGGERQRTALCRALVHRPRILLADEPTGSLDEKTGEEVFALLRQLARDESVTVIMATHERRFADACDRVFRMRNGQIEELNG